MNKEERKKLFEEIKTELHSSESVLVANALKNLDKHGDYTLIEPLLRAYMHIEEDENKVKMESMLSSLKVSQAEEVLIESLTKDEFQPIRKDILSFIWNSGFQPVEHIHTITAVATQGDYLTALEALTVIENIDNVASEEHILESTVEIRNYLNDHPNDEKRELIISLGQVIGGFTIE